MKKLLPIALMLLGPVFVVAGVYTASRGLDAKHQVRQELVAQDITTPPDASIPNTKVRDPGTAESMAKIIDKHAREATGGLTYAEMGRFLAKDGDKAGTNIEADALRGADGQPVRNPVRSVALEASTVRTGLYTSVMAFNVADLVMGLGVMMLALGLAFAGVGVSLRPPVAAAASRRVHLDSVAAQAA